MKTKRTLSEQQVDEIIALLEKSTSFAQSADLFSAIEAKIEAPIPSAFFNPKNLILPLLFLLAFANAIAVGTSLNLAQNNQRNNSISILASEYDTDLTTDYLSNE